MVLQATESTAERRPLSASVTGPPNARPVKAWAAAGAVILCIEAIALVGWIVSGDATPTGTGADPVPDAMKIAVRSAEGLGLVFFALFLFFFLVRPWKRAGHVTVDGLFCMVFAMIFWQDPLMNYFQHQLSYSAYWMNHGSWTTHLPGWLAPHGNLLAQPIVFYPAYVWGIFGGAVLGCTVMRRLKERHPGWSNTRLLLIIFWSFFGLELLVEPQLLRLGLWAYPGSIEWMTIFHGRYYQFPVYEGLFMAGLWTAWASLRFFRDDRGYTMAERGIDQLQVGGRRKTAIRFLALTGACNVIFLGVYNIPMAISGLYASPWPKAILDRSYLTDGLCGPGTDYACSGPGVPIPRPDSRHLSPDGTLVDPSAKH